MDKVQLKIKLKVILSLPLLAITLHCSAQEILSGNQDESHSPVQALYNQYSMQMEDAQRQVFLGNPALLHSTIDNPSVYYYQGQLAYRDTTDHVFVGADYNGGSQSGDYLPYQGRDFCDFNIRTNGYTRIGRSVLFGKAAFTKGTHSHYDWNSLRNAEDYWPYLTCDSTGGDYKYETYDVMGAYSFATSDHLGMGVSAEYIGDHAVRQNDPRSENVSSWLTLKYGATLSMGSTRAAIGLLWTNHHQHLDLDFFRTGQFAGFFFEYGFGMFDYIHSPIFNNTELIMHSNELGVNLALITNEKRTLHHNLWLEYRRNHMWTEENDYHISLYGTDTDKLGLRYALLYHHDQWGLSWFTDIDIARKDGGENLFERAVVSNIDNVDIYDYVKVGEQHRYKLTTLNSQSMAKASLDWRSSEISLSLGARYDGWEEKYTEKSFKILNCTLTPMAAIQFCTHIKSTILSFMGSYGRAMDMKHKYNVGVEMTKQTEFQHSFTPYAYRSFEGDVMTMKITASHRYTFGTIGISLQGMLQKCHRCYDVEYSESAYKVAVPALTRSTISLKPDKHDAVYGRATIFATF